jgi:Major Facilitator Superfamily
MTTATLTPNLKHNFAHLYADVAWFGLLSGSTLAFLTVYAARLGADAIQLGLISAGPALVNLAISLPAGDWLRRRPLIRSTFASSLWNRVAYLLLVPLPWLLGAQAQVWFLVAITALMSIPGTILAISFNATFADVVPLAYRGQIVGRRNALLAGVILATSLLCGLVLKGLAFPLNFQVVFGMGVVGALMSSYHLGQLVNIDQESQAPSRTSLPLNDVARPGLMRFMDAIRPASGLRFLTRQGDRLLRLDLIRGPFGSILLAYLLFHTAQYFSIPLFPLVWVSGLHLTDGVISIGNALFYGAMLAASLPIGRLSARIGHRRVLLLGLLTYGLYPFLLGSTNDWRIFLVASVVGGGVWALLNAGLLNYLMERTPKGDLPAHMALYNVVLNIGILTGSMVGPLVQTALGLHEALLIGAGIRFLSGIIFLFMRPPAPAANVG